MPMKPRKKGVKLVEGAELEYHGRKDSRFKAARGKGRDGKIGKGSLCSMEFHVTDTTKPLASAMAVVKAGNKVVLSLEDEGSYIENVKTKEKIMLKEAGGTFVFDVECEDGEKQGEDVEMMNASRTWKSTSVFSGRG